MSNVNQAMIHTTQKADATLPSATARLSTIGATAPGHIAGSLAVTLELTRLIAVKRRGSEALCHRNLCGVATSNTGTNQVRVADPVPISAAIPFSC